MIRSLQNAPHYNWGDQCDGWLLLNSPGMSVIQEKMPPGTKEKKHYHTTSQQLFYILQGSAYFDIDGVSYQVSVGESLSISPGLQHYIHNNMEEDLIFLVISQPSTHGQTPDRINVE